MVAEFWGDDFVKRSLDRSEAGGLRKRELPWPGWFRRSKESLSKKLRTGLVEMKVL